MKKSSEDQIGFLLLPIHRYHNIDVGRNIAASSLSPWQGQWKEKWITMHNKPNKIAFEASSF